MSDALITFQTVPGSSKYIILRRGHEYIDGWVFDSNGVRDTLRDLDKWMTQKVNIADPEYWPIRTYVIPLEFLT